MSALGRVATALCPHTALPTPHSAKHPSTVCRAAVMRNTATWRYFAPRSRALRSLKPATARLSSAWGELVRGAAGAVVVDGDDRGEVEGGDVGGRRRHLLRFLAAALAERGDEARQI